MKNVARILAALAAAAATASGASAADLPGAEPVDYVKVCDVKGRTGFFVVPGTDTCLQLGGYVRAEVTSGEIVRSAALPASDTANRTGYRARARLWFDARTQSEYGTVRTFIRLQFQRETGVVGQPASVAALDASDALFDLAFVQFAGLTAGNVDSFWDFKPYRTFQNPFISDRSVPALGYTMKFGDVSASVALEDPTMRYRTIANAHSNSGLTIPDIVTNLRVEQSWGEAQLSGVLHRVKLRRDNGFPAIVPPGWLPGENSPTGDQTWGWGGQAGVKIDLATAGTSDRKGDYVWGSLGYVDGAGLAYLGIGDQSVGSGRTENIVSLFQPTRDFVLVDGRTHKTRGMNANLSILHYWTPQWRSTLSGTYIDVNYRKIDADWKAGSIAGNLIWSPVKKLDIGAELVYIRNIKKAEVGYLGGRDADAFVGRIRVQRDF